MRHALSRAFHGPGNPMPKSNYHQRRAQRRAALAAERKRQAQATQERNAVARAERDRIEERRQEAIVPAAQRKPVVGPDKIEVVREARLQAAGAGFVHSNPIRHLLERGAARAERGEEPPVRPHHARAVDRLAVAWRMAGEGVTAGVGSYGDTRAGDGVGPSPAVVYQIQCRQEIDAAAAWLGALWPVVRDVGLRGITLTAWARSQGFAASMAPGYLRAGLDRLCEFYAARSSLHE